MRDTTTAALICAAIAAGSLTGCTDVKENFPEGGCLTDELRCIGNDLAKCSEDQSGFIVIKQCTDESPCGGTPLDCEGKVLVGGGAACAEDADCAAQLGEVGACYMPVCTEGSCKVAPALDGTGCDDANACTADDACTTGLCSGTPLGCDDDDPCTSDSCDAAVGCVNQTVAGLPCDDGDQCTKSDLCNAEATCAGTALDCDDGNQCTADQCDLATGECASQTIGGDCDDGDDCTEGEKCSGGTCQGGEFTCSCETVDDCLADGPADPCKGSYICQDEVCQTDPTTAITCPQDGLGPCHVNQCVSTDTDVECVVQQKSEGTPCSDGNVCTSSDMCQVGECVGTDDGSIAGCGAFHIGWYALTLESTWMMTLDQEVPDLGKVQLHGTAGYPQIYGQTQNAEYRVRAIAPGLTK
ncbi:MAG: hypothetical protein ACI9WU_004417 [Myxococcota bacterium]